MREVFHLVLSMRTFFHLVLSLSKGEVGTPGRLLS